MISDGVTDMNMIVRHMMIVTRNFLTGEKYGLSLLNLFIC